MLCIWDKRTSFSKVNTVIIHSKCLYYYIFAITILFVTIDHLKVMNVIGETSVQVTNQAQSFQWKGYGIKLHVPQGTLPAGFKQCDVLIKVAVSGEFRLPHYTTLVSAVYWIDCKPQCEFAKPVVLELQHCASPSQTNKLSFAKCSLNALPPYMFEILEGGEFDNQSAYGRIELRSFSLITQLLRSTPLLTGIVKQDNKHHARVFYLWKSEELREIHFVLTKALEAHATVCCSYHCSLYSIDLVPRLSPLRRGRAWYTLSRE